MDGVQEAVYFLPLGSKKFLVPIGSTLEGWKAEMILKSSIGFELVYQPSYYQM